jgi:hypothetical protein
MKYMLDITYSKTVDLEIPAELMVPGKELELNEWCWARFKELHENGNASEFVVATICETEGTGNQIWES